MEPEYLQQLADRADPRKLWRQAGLGHDKFSEEERQQLDTGVALRRLASIERTLIDALHAGKSLVITPLGPSTTGRALALIDVPAKHRKLLAVARRAG